MKSPAEYQNEYLINGKIEQWVGDHQDVFSPICDESGKKINIGYYPKMDKETALKALESACNAYGKGLGLWPTMSVKDRIGYVQKFVTEMKKEREAVVNLLMWEIGKNQPDSEKEFNRTIQYINDTINALIDLDRNSSRFVTEDNILAQIRRSPLGVTLCMAPFNYPLNELFTTLIPALIMGNTVVFKPAKFGVLLFRKLLNAFQVFPAGVVNTVYGDGKEIISPLMASGKIDVLAFIGSSKVADILKRHHPYPHRLKCVLGLEAKNVAIILPSCDIDKTIKECVTGSLSFNGQRCTALKLLFVHYSIKELFLKKFINAVEELICGMPWKEQYEDKGEKFSAYASITPLPEDNKVEFLESLIEDAEKIGAEINRTICIQSVAMPTLFSPVIVSGVTKNMRLFNEEQFGPIVPIAFFMDINEVVNSIVESNYGQQVSIFASETVEMPGWCPENETPPTIHLNEKGEIESTESVGKLIDQLANQVCRINLNCQCQRGPDAFPFNGRKDSAENTLSITDALKVFSIRTIVATKAEPENKALVQDILTKHCSNFLNTDYIL